MARAGGYAVTSPDGVPIAVWRSGRGPALLLVHGMVADHSTTWRRVLPGLERSFTVHAMDRRGRGGSGDDAQYGLDREAADVATVARAIGEPVFLVGHSYGALCALEGALLIPSLQGLVLYEGPIVRPAPPSRAVMKTLEEYARRGDAESLLRSFLGDVAGLSGPEIDLLRADREGWRVRLGNAGTVPRELRAEAGYRFDPERFPGLGARTLILVGGESPTREVDAARALARALPAAGIRVLEGQGHLAMYTAPELFVSALGSFAEGGA